MLILATRCLPGESARSGDVGEAAGDRRALIGVLFVAPCTVASLLPIYGMGSCNMRAMKRERELFQTRNLWPVQLAAVMFIHLQLRVLNFLLST